MLSNELLFNACNASDLQPHRSVLSFFCHKAATQHLDVASLKIDLRLDVVTLYSEPDRWPCRR